MDFDSSYNVAKKTELCGNWDRSLYSFSTFFPLPVFDSVCFICPQRVRACPATHPLHEKKKTNPKNKTKQKTSPVFLVWS